MHVGGKGKHNMNSAHVGYTQAKRNITECGLSVWKCCRRRPRVFIEESDLVTIRARDNYSSNEETRQTCSQRICRALSHQICWIFSSACIIMASAGS
jgi:hypothetical protein